MIDRARKILTRAIKRLSKPPVFEPKLIRKALEQNNLAAATEQIESAKQQFPGRSDVNELYAQIHAKHESWAKVRTAIKQIAADSHASIQQQIEAAKLFRKLGDDDKAIELFRRAGQDSFEKQAAVTWNSLGSIYLQRGEPATALNAFADCASRRGPMIWPQVLTALQACSLDEVAECRKKMYRYTANPDFGYQYYKMLSLLEQKLHAGGRMDKEAMLRNIQKASQLSFADLYPDIPSEDTADPLKPSFLIIGAMKCGTTSLFNLIAQHPKCLVPFEKELHFFQFTELSSQWYFEHFPRVSPAAGYISGDASPGYYTFDIVDRVKELLPDVKLIFIQRDPAQRAISHVKHNSQFGLGVPGAKQVLSRIDLLEQEIADAPEKAEQAILDITYLKRKHNNFLALGCYELLLRRWRKAFGPDQLLTLELEDLSQNLQATMAEVFRFIGVEPIEVAPMKLNQGSSNRSDPQTQLAIQRLEAFYQRVTKLTTKSESRLKAPRAEA